MSSSYTVADLIALIRTHHDADVREQAGRLLYSQGKVDGGNEIINAGRKPAATGEGV